MLGQPLEQLEYLVRVFAEILPYAVGAGGGPLPTRTAGWPPAIALLQESVQPTPRAKQEADQRRAAPPPSDERVIPTLVFLTRQELQAIWVPMRFRLLVSSWAFPEDED